MKYWQKAVLGGVILGLIVLSGFFSLTIKNKEKPRGSLKTVQTILPELSNKSVSFTFSAQIYPVESAQLFARANGFIQKRYVDIGDKVKEGQLLATLSSPELEEQMKQAEAQIKLQEATVSLAKIQFDRIATLLKKGAISKAAYDENQAAYQVSVARHELYTAQLMRLKKEFEYTQIRAPFEGIISQRHKDKGDRISINDTIPLFKLIQIKQLLIVVDIPQTQLFTLEKGKVITLKFSERPNQVFKAKFVRMADRKSTRLNSSH